MSLPLSLEWHVWLSSSGNNCHAVHWSLASGASVWLYRGILLCPILSAKPTHANVICNFCIFGMACLAGSKVNIQHKDCRIHRLPLSSGERTSQRVSRRWHKERLPSQGSKEISFPSLPLLPGPLWPRVVVPVKSHSSVKWNSWIIHQCANKWLVLIQIVSVT